MAVIGETVTVLRAPLVTDEYGTETSARDWTNPSQRTIDGVAVAPRSSSEFESPGRTAVIVGLSIYAPPGADIEPHDRIIVRGDMFEVEGEPGLWVSPFTGQAKGVEVALSRVAG